MLANSARSASNASVFVRAEGNAFRYRTPLMVLWKYQQKAAVPSSRCHSRLYTDIILPFPSRSQTVGPENLSGSDPPSASRGAHSAQTEFHASPEADSTSTQSCRRVR